MKQRSPIAVFLLPFVTFGIYGIYWSVSTKNELKARGADIPTAWLLIVPIVNYYWYWKYSQGTELVTKGKFTAPVTFLMLVFIGVIGMAILQDTFNKLDATPVAAGTPGGQPLPDDSFGGQSFGSAGTPIVPSTPAEFSTPTPIAPTPVASAPAQTVAPVSFDQISPAAPAPITPPAPIPAPTPTSDTTTPPAQPVA